MVAREQSWATNVSKPNSLHFLLAVLSYLLPTAMGFSASAPMTVSQLALYQGADREKILIEGAKKQGQLTFYNSHTWFRTFVKDFEKKYPFIKVSEWRNDSKNVLRRMLEESKSARSLVDVVETTPETMGVLKRDGLLQEYYSPEARYYPDELKPKGKSGFFYLPDRETYSSLGFNTALIPTAAAPRSLKDLLDPKWKGKMRDHQHLDRGAMDRQCARQSGTRIPGKNGRAGGPSARYGRSRFARPGCLR